MVEQTQQIQNQNTKPKLIALENTIHTKCLKNILFRAMF